MPITRRTYLIALAVLIAIILAGTTYYVLFHPKRQTIISYACADGSFYLVIQRKDAIEVAGQVYGLVSESDGLRYEGAGPLAYTVRGTSIEVENKITGTSVASCTQGQTEGLPAVESLES